MSRSAWIAVLAGGLLSCGCKERSSVPAEEEARRPVVKIAPVPTQPYEEGYRFGFDLGKQQAAPKSKVPDPEDMQGLAREQAAGYPERTARWERGFADGYVDGFRNVVTGQK